MKCLAFFITSVFSLISFGEEFSIDKCYEKLTTKQEVYSCGPGSVFFPLNERLYVDLLDETREKVKKEQIQGFCESIESEYREEKVNCVIRLMTVGRMTALEGIGFGAAQPLGFDNAVNACDLNHEEDWTECIRKNRAIQWDWADSRWNQGTMMDESDAIRNCIN